MRSYIDGALPSSNFECTKSADVAASDTAIDMGDDGARFLHEHASSSEQRVSHVVRKQAS